MESRNPGKEEREDRFGFRREGRDLLRAVAAGTLVGMPLLYTMEMWWHGMMLDEWHLLSILGVTLVANFVFSLFSGFRDIYNVPEAVSESISSVGMGIVISGLVLLLIREITLDASFTESLGKILVEAIPVSLGVSFANSKMRDRGADEDGDAGEEPDFAQHADPHKQQLWQDLRQAGAAAAGALLFSFNAAPTEEIVLIASRMPSWHLLLLIPASLLLCYVIVFAAEFKGHRVIVQTFFQKPLVEVVLVYAIALLVSAMLLWMVGMRVDLASPATFTATVITLGLVAAVGGAAGRLAA